MIKGDDYGRKFLLAVVNFFWTAALSHSRVVKLWRFYEDAKNLLTRRAYYGIMESSKGERPREEKWTPCTRPTPRTGATGLATRAGTAGTRAAMVTPSASTRGARSLPARLAARSRLPSETGKPLTRKPRKGFSLLVNLKSYKRKLLQLSEYGRKKLAVVNKIFFKL